MSFIAALLVFGLIVLIHEFGHFIVAKKCGIGVVEFSIGMGPRLCSFTKGETRYSIKILPLGGSCMMVGEDESDPDPKAFNNKSVWARIAVIAAGPVFNFILAFALALIIIGYAGYDKPQLAGVIDGFPAQEQGLQEGDILTEVNGEKITVYRDLQMYQMLNPEKPMQVTYDRPLADGSGMEQRSAYIVPKYSEEDGSFMMGVLMNNYRTPVTSIGEAIKYGTYEVSYAIKSVISGLGMLISGQLGREDLGGPVRIISMIDETVDVAKEYGIANVMLNLVNMCLLLSANLGVVNLLPIPALDGGRLMFLVLEALRGRPIDPEKEGMVHMIGMVFLMGLMVVLLFNDVSYLFFS